MSEPRVSVIVPFRNRRHLLADCLGGLARQTYRDFEVILIDDGSTDGAAEEAQHSSLDGTAIRVVQSAGRGAVEARRTGIAESYAEVLAFTDSDCAPEAGWLAALVDAMDGGADLVQGRTLPARPPALQERTMAVPGPDPRFPTCNIAYRRTVYDKAEGFDVTVPDRIGFRPRGRLTGLDFGVDTSLAWRVLRAGGQSRFAHDAVVRHAVFPFDRGESLRRAWMSGALPMLLREVPEVATLLRRGVLYGAIDKLPLYGAVAAAGLRRPRVATVCVGAWVALTARRLLLLGADSTAPSLRFLPDALAIDAVGVAALVCGSIRARRIVL